MYVVVRHELSDPPAAFARGERLKRGEGAPAGAVALQFLPSAEGTTVTCLWETRSVEDVQSYVDGVLGETSVNTCYAVDAEHAFAEHPGALSGRPVAATG